MPFLTSLPRAFLISSLNQSPSFSMRNAQRKEGKKEAGVVKKLVLVTLLYSPLFTWSRRVP
jgi:hypothetical protein